MDRRISTSHPPELSRSLASWYDGCAEVRGFLATHRSEALPAGKLRILVVLEPTADGSDVLPVWMANAPRWVGLLKERTGREVSMELVQDLPPIGVEPVRGEAIIAAGRWRDPTVDEA